MLLPQKKLLLKLSRSYVTFCDASDISTLSKINISKLPFICSGIRKLYLLSFATVTTDVFYVESFMWKVVNSQINTV